MARRKWRKLAILAKVETTYGQDAVPSGGANAILAVDATLTPLEGQELSRDLLLPYLGHQGVILAGLHATLEFSVEIAGSGVAGTVPGYGPLHRGCGLSETITAGTSVVYQPVSDGEEAVTIYFNRDGVRHVLLGARGSITLELAPLAIPRYRYRFLGLLGTITDTALPAVNVAIFKKPLVVSKANTTMTLHGLACIAERLSLDLGNQIEPRFLIGDEGIELVDRRMTGSAVLQANDLATKNWIAVAMDEVKAPLSAVHGKVSGQIVEFSAPAVQIGKPGEGQTQGIVNNTLPLMLTPVTGNDEFSITVR